MRVLFKRTWFAPGGQRFRKSIDKYDYRNVPVEFRDKLPSDAEILSDAETRLRPAEERKALKDFDEARQMGEVVISAKEKADAEQEAREKAARFQAQLAAEAAEAGEGEPEPQPVLTPKQRRDLAKKNALRERE